VKVAQPETNPAPGPNASRAHDPRVWQRLFLQAALELRAHRRRRLDRDDLGGGAGQQRLVAPRARANVEHAVGWAQARQQELHEAVGLGRLPRRRREAPGLASPAVGAGFEAGQRRLLGLRALVVVHPPPGRQPVVAAGAVRFYCHIIIFCSGAAWLPYSRVG
jgi:hypothetical protein